jgi:hypothetical protein
MTARDTSSRRPRTRAAAPAERVATMLRASLTRAEYNALRIAALNEGRSTKELAGDAIRQYLNQTRKGKRS